MPAEIFGERYEFLPKKDILRFDEIYRLTKVFVGLGVTKVRITGGEPLLRNNLEELVSQLRFPKNMLWSPRHTFI